MSVSLFRPLCSLLIPVQSPDGSKIAMSSETGQLYLFDIDSSQLLNTYTSHAMCVRSIAWSPDGQVRIFVLLVVYTLLSFACQLLISASDDKRIIMHDVRNAGKGGGAVASLTGHSSWVLSASVSPDAKLVASGFVSYPLFATILSLNFIEHQQISGQND